MIRLRTLGECVVEVDGEPLGPDADTAFAILVLLAGERGRQLSRRHVAELFWPGCPESRARHSLRQLLYRLRGLGVELDAGREHVRLDPELIVPTFASDPTVERLREGQAAGTLVVGPYLPGYAPGLSPAFQEWLDARRSRVEAQVRRALLQAVQEHQLRGEWMAAEALARECLRIDPLNEDATYKRAECVAMMGGKAEALAILDRYNAEMSDRGTQVTLPTAVLRRRIAEQLPMRRYAIPSDRCFVGRESLMSVLTLALLRAKNREGSGVLLWGPSGIGKTRVTQELMTLAAVQGARVVRVQCEESDVRQPMATWVDGVPQLLRLPGALGVSPDAMPFLRRLTESDPTLREPSPEARDPQYLAGRIRQSILDLVDAVANEGPLLLVLEDVHWMDGASWAVLRLLLEWNTSKRVLILLTSRRPHATPAPPQRELPRLEVHEVRALEPGAASLLVRAIAADFGSPISEEAEAWCLAVSEGNPLYLRELVVDCLEAGKPRAVPPSVQALLDARIARVRPGARQVLQACATLGEHATIDRLDAVLGMPAYDVVGALDELSESGLVASVGATVQPRHEVVAARIAAATSEASRRLLHRRAATVLEREVERGAGLDVMWACTRHWQAAGDSPRALRLALAFASRLIELGIPDDALAICEGMESLCTGRKDAFDVQRTKARALQLAARFQQSLLAFLELAKAERGEVPHQVWAADVLSALEAETRAAGFTASGAAGAAELASDPYLDRELRLQAGQLAVRIAANIDAATIAARAWSAVRDLAVGTSQPDVPGLLLMMVYNLSFGDFQAGCWATKELATRARQLPPAYATTEVFLMLVDGFRICGMLDSAAEMAEAAFTLSTRFAAKYRAFRAALNACEIAFEQHRVHAARQWFRELLARAGDMDERESALEIRHLAARVHLLDGDAAGAYALTRALLEEYQSYGYLSPRQHRALLTTLIETQLADSNALVDATLLDQLLDLHTATRRHPLQERTVRVLCGALERADRKAEATSLRAMYDAMQQRSPAIGD